MFLHVGADCMIKNSDIIAIFNLRRQAFVYEEFVRQNYDGFRIVDLCDDNKHASLILTAHTLYFSPIHSYTLRKRAQALKIFSKACDFVSLTLPK